MSDTKISSLTAASSVLAADQLAVNEAGTSKRVTASQLKDFVQAAVLTDSPSADAISYAPTNFANASIVSLTPTVSISIAGMAAATGNLVRTLLNATTTQRIILLTHEDPTATTATERFNFGQALPFYVLLPGESATFYYDTTLTRWRFLYGSHCATLAGQFDEFTDLHDGILPTEVTGSPVGGLSYVFSSGLVDSTAVGADATEKSQGVIRLSTSSSAAGKAHIVSGIANGIVPAQGGVFMVTRCSVATLSTGSERYQVRFGLQDSSGGTDVTDGLYWEYDEANSPTWRKASSLASSRTKSDITGFTVTATVNNYLGIWVNSDWTRADYFYSVDGVSWPVAVPASITTNMPTVSALVELGIGINKTIGTTARTLDVDWIGWRFYNQQR